MSKIWIFLAIALIPLVTSLPMSDKGNDDTSQTDDSVSYDNFGEDIQFELGPEEWVYFVPDSTDEEAESLQDDPLFKILSVPEEEITAYTPAPNYEVYTGQSKFAVSLLKSISKSAPKQSCLISPHSTYRALLLAYFGAEGQTRKSMEIGLFLDWAGGDKSKFTKAFDAEWKARAQRQFGHEIQFQTAEELYVTKDAELNPSNYLTKAMDKVDFSNPEKCRQKINDFVEEITENNIKDLLPPGSVTPATNLLLANAAYFRGLWATQFDKSLTQKKPFNGATSSDDVNMMSVRGRFKYGVNDEMGASYLELPYLKSKTAYDKNADISMLVFLPLENTATAVNDLLDKFSAEAIEKASSNRITSEVDVQFPKFSLDGSYVMGNIIEDVGIKGLFGSEADLSGFSNTTHLHFDDMVHKAKIEIDEEGSIAAAATATMSRFMAFIDPAEPIQFHCDHPFVFAIYDRITNDVLFAGVYRGPN